MFLHLITTQVEELSKASQVHTCVWMNKNMIVQFLHFPDLFFLSFSTKLEKGTQIHGKERFKSTVS